MKSTTFAIVATVLVSLLAVSESGVTSLESRSIIDPIIKEILNRLRPKFADLKFDDIDEVVKSPELNATIKVNKILIQNLDKYEIKILNSNIAPLKLTNLTLAWKEIVASAVYDFDVSVNPPKFNGPFRVYGKGNAKAILKNIYFTIGANMEMKSNTLQVKPKGLFGFDLKIEKVNVTVTSIMGSTEFGDALGAFLSNVIPDLVDSFKKPVFYSFQDEIIKIVNEVLKGKNTFIGSAFDDSEQSEDLIDRFFIDLSDESSEESF